ncbi:HtaA protein [Corynebacterium sp. MSK297]|uniref:HtaA protein n=1 Tax=Corynebacterium sp. MSK297 TaxID=3050221 RepID=UPI00254CACAC|nr:HtaA protein [Corynebacterium sp. MSK297]MDK8845196.1 HtaA protein [Corynebacterium sp. MSK297]
MNTRLSLRTTSISAALLTLALGASTLAPDTFETTPQAHAATPVIPDDLPIFPKVTENPQVSVTFEDGTPVEGATVHRGDVLLVHGTGFSPEANQGGFPLPVPPGVPNGLYALYGAFPAHWKPSEGADPATRTHPHDRMAWVMPEGTLERIPSGVIDMRRSIARQEQPMNADGSFTARIVVDPPETTPGDNWGVYVYPGAGSINAAEEFYIPLNYSSEPGPNTPAPPQPDLLLNADLAFRFAEITKGGVNAKNGASKVDANRVAFTRDAAAENGDGVRKYKGTVITTARFTLAEVAVADPWLIPQPDGSYLITGLISRSYNVGADEMVRVPLGLITANQAAHQVRG